MSWDPQIASIIGAGFSAVIYAADTGAPYTTDSLKMTLEEVQNACKAVKEGAAGAVNASVGGKTYMVLRNDEDMCYFKKKGEGGGCFGGTYNEGQQAGKLHDLLAKVVQHFKYSGY